MRKHHEVHHSSPPILPLQYIPYIPIIYPMKKWVITIVITLSGWGLTYPSEKYERQWEGLSYIIIVENKKCICIYIYICTKDIHS